MKREDRLQRPHKTEAQVRVLIPRLPGDSVAVAREKLIVLIILTQFNLQFWMKRRDRLQRTFNAVVMGSSPALDPYKGRRQ